MSYVYSSECYASEKCAAERQFLEACLIPTYMPILSIK